ncbi:MAG: DUF2147 domain-containing protein [Amylibacter sp.]|jgi:uncharacterized protein (DUF2147 family)|nr:DUF2147 domain-containing protein [Amylibacter sp.]
MKKLALIAVMAAFASPTLADDVFGDWKTAPDENGYTGIIRIAACGSKICGTNIQSFDPSGKAVKTKSTGTKLLKNFVASGGGKYLGEAFNPADGKTYKGKLALTSKNVLNVKGCIAFICKTQGNWKRQ